MARRVALILVAVLALLSLALAVHAAKPFYRVDRADFSEQDLINERIVTEANAAVAAFKADRQAERGTTYAVVEGQFVQVSPDNAVFFQAWGASSSMSMNGGGGSAASWTLKYNLMSSQSLEEFAENYCQAEAGADCYVSAPSVFQRRNATERSARQLSNVDNSYMSPSGVGDQGLCGVCWAFSGNTVNEIYAYLKHGSTTAQSIQNLINCMHIQGSNEQVEHGSMCLGSTAYAGIMALGQTMQSYALPASSMSYFGTDANYAEYYGECQYGSITTGVCGYSMIRPGYESNMLTALQENGALSAGIVSTCYTHTLYGGGVYSDTTCVGPTDHAVAIVGYGTDEDTGMEYWLCKNSWGTSWGAAGMMMMQMGYNIAGVAQEAYYATSC